MSDGMSTVWLGHLLGFSAMNSGQKCVSKQDYNLSAPRGVNGRSSDNTLMQQYLKWEPTVSLIVGLRKAFDWIGMQIEETYAVTR
jgi:nucleoside-diphosphate-sugar epimerase